MNGMPDEEDTLDNSAKFSKAITHFFTKMIGTSTKSEYTMRFHYCGDISPSGDLPPPSKYFVDEDIIKLIKYIYPTTPLQDIAEDDDTVASFFGDNHVKQGCSLILLEN